MKFTEKGLEVLSEITDMTVKDNRQVRVEYANGQTYLDVKGVASDGPMETKDYELVAGFSSIPLKRENWLKIKQHIVRGG